MTSGILGTGTLIKTDKTADMALIKTMFQLPATKDPADKIVTLTGAWVRDGDLWRWYSANGQM